MRLGCLLSLTAALAAAAPAGAQTTGSHIGRDLGEKDGAAAMQVIANCIAARRPEMVARWFRLLPGSQEEYQLLRGEEGDLSVCMDSKDLVMDGKEVGFQPSSLRLPVARAAVRAALRNAPDQSPAGRDSDPWFVTQLDQLTANAQANRTYLAMLDFGHCVAVHDWPGSMAFLRAKPQSPEESAAIKEMVPVLGPCLPANSKIAVTPVNLRDMLAEPVLHLVKGWGGAPAVAAAHVQQSTRK